MNELLGITRAYGLYEINRVQVEADGLFFRDIAILSTVSDDGPFLSDMAQHSGAICCYVLPNNAGLDQ